MAHFFTNLLSGAVMLLLLGCGIFLSIKSGFFQFRGLPFILRNTVGTLFRRQPEDKGRGISPFQAVTTALAGTMGVGNIAGVATALTAAGPGAVFWMWISALCGMMTKYAEIYLAVKFRKKTADGYIGGPMYYISEGAGKKRLAALFAVLCALCSLGIGNISQVNSVSTAMSRSFGVPTLVSGLAVAAVVALVVFGGVKRIARVTELVIPFISILYLCGAGAFLYIHRHSVVGALAQIVDCAFSPASAAGGALGYGMSRAMRFGLSRGVFTNEAGLGSAPIAHAAADCKSPKHQGVWGIFEVFLDTIVVCTVTALVLLCAGDGLLWRQSGLDGAALTSAAFESVFGAAGGRFIALSIVFFAVAAMLGWCYYGESAVRYLAGVHGNTNTLYRLLFILCIIPGAMGELGAVWGISDALNALMAIPNIIALLILRKQISTADT